MGLFLAKEVKKEIGSYTKTIDKINFIGYSLGGLIIRVALGHLE